MPRTQPPDVRREQILRAAEQLFIADGLSASIADVAEAAGVAKGTVYLYFASRDELVAALRARYLGEYVAALTVEGDTARERLNKFVVALFEFGGAHHRLHHVLFHEAGISEHDAFASVRVLISNILRDGAAAGEFTMADPAMTVNFILHGVHGTLVETLHHGAESGPRRLKKTAAAVADLVDRLLD